MSAVSSPGRQMGFAETTVAITDVIVPQWDHSRTKPRWFVWTGEPRPVTSVKDKPNLDINYLDTSCWTTTYTVPVCQSLFQM